jgi:hypothetical protein
LGSRERVNEAEIGQKATFWWSPSCIRVKNVLS